MEDNPFEALARQLRGSDAPAALSLGSVSSWPDRDHPDRPHRVIARGNTQEKEDLLSNPGLLPYALAAGDTVVLLGIEEDQRYVILCKAVEV